MSAEQLNNPNEVATPLGKTMKQPPAPLVKLIGEIGTDSVSWMKRGACRGVDPGVFFPGDDDEAIEAKSVCADCVVRVDCLEYALTTGQLHGVWGGATERERRRLRRRRRRTA